jgi:CP family cyanate transporter-like MFS transporter
MTFLMGAGIAVSQPTFAALVGQWFNEPRWISRATGVWSNGLLIGEVLSAALTLPIVLPLVGSWQATLAVWSAPVLLTAVLLAVTQRTAASVVSVRMTLPDWRDPRLWQLGVLQSSASLIYFGANTFIPDFLHATNQPDLVGPALAALNGGQVPASLVIGLVPMRVLARRTASLSVAGAIVLALVGVVTLPGVPTVVAAGLFGFCAAYILILTFALPALLVGASGAARLSAGTFAISYTLAFLVTLLAGAIWDTSHVAASAFLPVLASSVIVASLGPRLASAAAH